MSTIVKLEAPKQLADGSLSGTYRVLPGNASKEVFMTLASLAFDGDVRICQLGDAPEESEGIIAVEKLRAIESILHPDTVSEEPQIPLKVELTPPHKTVFDIPLRLTSKEGEATQFALDKTDGEATAGTFEASIMAGKEADNEASETNS